MDGYMTIVQHDEYAKRMDDEHKRQNRRISKLEDDVKENNKLILAVDRMAHNMEEMLEEQKEQGKRLEALESRDGEAWKNMKDKLIGAFLGAIGTSVAGAFIYSIVQFM